MLIGLLSTLLAVPVACNPETATEPESDATGPTDAVDTRPPDDTDSADDGVDRDGADDDGSPSDVRDATADGDTSGSDTEEPEDSDVGDTGDVAEDVSDASPSDSDVAADTDVASDTTDALDADALDTGDSSDTSGPYGRVEDFLDAYEKKASRVVCEYMRKCLFPVVSGSTTVQSERICPDGSSWTNALAPTANDALYMSHSYEHREAVERGLRNYSPSKARECIRRLGDELSDSTSCEISDQMAKVCSEVVTPARGNGETCLADRDCQSDTVCVESSSSGFCSATCQTPTTGTRCGRNFDLERCTTSGLYCNSTDSQCASTKSQGATCSEDSTCEGTLVCLERDGSETCEMPLEQGDECERDGQCGSGLSCRPNPSSPSTCQPLGTAGDACDTITDCKADRVDNIGPGEDGPDSDDYFCVFETAQLEKGTCRQYHSQSTGDDCETSRVCQPGLACIEGTCKSAAIKTMGEKCGGDAELCESGLVCRPDSTAGNTSTCTQPGGQGALCDPLTQKGTPCERDLFCHRDAISTQGVGECQTPIGQGESCDYIDECEDGTHCDGIECIQSPGIGDGCTSYGRNCVEGACFGYCGGRYGSCPSP